ncbi:hypothetical protein DL95DRAFT_379735 [Leptodontidium sp. 2 PMI_412]|nr:hypothetical protein DL95DRAFT_379735 [Leptodontidium sp. 2 PMI_412]
MASGWDLEQGRQPVLGVHERPHNAPPIDPDYNVFGQRLSAVGIDQVFYQPHKFPGDWHINLGNLQRMMLHHVQRELVEEVSKMKEAGSMDQAQAGRITSALSSYTSGIRDWELMVKYSSKGKSDPSLDPFVFTSANLLEKRLMSDAGLVKLRSREIKHVDTAIKEGNAFLPPITAGTRLAYNQDMRNSERWDRLYMALFGGIAVVGPMLIMVLYKHQLSSILTVSVCVFLFGLWMAFFSTGNPETVLAAVAAYAAVLVVFIGTST